MTFLLKHPILLIAALVVLSLLIWAYWGTHTPQITPYTLRSPRLPAAFDGLRIVQVSDLHNTAFGKDGQVLPALLAQVRPDLILITGDLLDSKRTHVATAVEFVRQAAALAPVYYVPGNHEARIPEAYAQLKEELSALGVVILENESVPYEKDGDRILLTGLTDPSFGLPWPDVSADAFQLALSHRPELLDVYAQMGLDLVLTGHAHGGQFRLPFIGGLFAPQQGFFPAYTDGVHRRGSTAMVVSRGLGNVPLIPRFNNRPELVLITLESL